MLQLKTDDQTPDVSCSSIDEVKNIRDKLSLKVLRTLDQEIQSIIHKTPFVTLYEMNNDERWNRAGIEGFLYIVLRSIKPLYSFVIINKKSETHLIEHITPEFQMNHNGNFIFYSTARVKTACPNKLNGLWFFDENECKNTYEKILNITANSVPLHYSLTPFLSELCKNSKDTENTGHITKSVFEQRTSETIEKSSEYTKFSIFSKIMPNANIDTGNLNVANKQNEPSEDVNNSKTNKEGQRLISMLYSYGKTEYCDAPPIQKVETSGNDKNTIARAGDSNLNISYNKLKSAIEDVIKSDEFVTLVWERLQVLSSSADSYN